MLKEEKIIEELKKLGVNPPKIIYYELTDSTNPRAKEYAKENPDNKEPVVFIANAQSAGRGRRGRSFISNEGAGIYMSILSYPDKKGADATTVTAKTAVAMTKAVESLCDCDIQIKWVNDLYLGGKKLAGILVEGEMNNEGEIAHQVVGMGINVYKNAISDEICDIATSIESETGKGIDRSKLAAAIIKYHLNYTGDFYTEYKSRSFIIGKKVTVMKLSKSYEAEVVDIDRDFSLIIDCAGKTERLFTGEISLKV